MGISARAGSGRTRRARRRRIRAETIEAALIVALAGLVFVLGARVLAGVGLAVGTMMMALTRL